MILVRFIVLLPFIFLIWIYFGKIYTYMLANTVRLLIPYKSVLNNGILSIIYEKWVISFNLTKAHLIDFNLSPAFTLILSSNREWKFKLKLCFAILLIYFVLHIIYLYAKIQVYVIKSQFFAFINDSFTVINPLFLFLIAFFVFYRK